MNSESSTCAVLVIHGIGEQRPMGTLRGFVEGVLNDEEQDPKFFNKFDGLSETFRAQENPEPTQATRSLLRVLLGLQRSGDDLRPCSELVLFFAASLANVE